MVEAVERSGAAAFRGSSPVTPSSEREANAWNYGLTRVVYTDAPPRSEKRGQERHEERVVDTMERSGAIGLTRVVDPEPRSRSGSWAWAGKGSPGGGCKEEAEL